MADEEHEVYGQEIPLDGEDVDMGAPGDEAAKMQELDEMKRRLKEMEEEANALREMQTKVAKEMQGQCCRTPCVELPFRGDGLIL